MGRANWDGIEGLFAGVDRAECGRAGCRLRHRRLHPWTLTAIEALPHTVGDLGADAVLAIVADRDGRSRLRGLIERA